MIDQGGAQYYERQSRLVTLPGVAAPPREPTVTISVVETHNGVECGCIDGETRILRVGDRITLDHVCVDGRVDQVIATIRGITP